MSYSFIAFIFVCLVIWITAVVKLSKMPRAVSSIIVAVLFLLIFIFYGQRWFYGPAINNDPNGTWPPIINMCPDYLLYFKRNGVDTCIDMSGINRSGGSRKSWTQDDNFQNPSTDNAKYFPYVYKPGMTDGAIKNLCTQAMAVGLTWEGITNGESCTYYNSGALATASDSKNCGAGTPSGAYTLA